jgi:hypothetical protein
MVVAAAELDRILGYLPHSGAGGQASREALRRLEMLPDQELVADLGSK